MNEKVLLHSCARFYTAWSFKKDSKNIRRVELLATVRYLSISRVRLRKVWDAMKERHEWVEVEIGVLKEENIKGSWNSKVVNCIRI